MPFHVARGFRAASFQKKVEQLAAKSEVKETSNDFIAECSSQSALREDLSDTPALQKLAKRVYAEVFQRYGFNSEDSLPSVLEPLPGAQAMAFKTSTRG